MTAAAELVGQVFARLTVLARAEPKGPHGARWLTKCECGQFVTARTYELRAGHVKSCGCLQREKARESLRQTATKHGQSHTRTWSSWKSMLDRCNSPTHRVYARYGGAGITVCERWLQFENFLADMGHRPAGTTLDRRDNSRGYEPDNCRWATAGEQTRNRSITRFIEFNGRRMCLTDWAAEVGITESALAHRIAKGWSLQRALTEPHHNTGPRRSA